MFCGCLCHPHGINPGRLNPVRSLRQQYPGLVFLYGPGLQGLTTIGTGAYTVEDLCYLTSWRVHL